MYRKGVDCDRDISDFKKFEKDCKKEPMIEMSAYIVLGVDGVRRMTKTQPRLGPKEVATIIKFVVPKDIFKRPTISATITLDKAPQCEFNLDVLSEIEQYILDKYNNIDIKVVNK